MGKFNFSATINAGARSALTHITRIGPFNKLYITGVAVSSEVNTTWRIKFYKKDTGIVTTYANNTFIGDVEITSLSATASTYFEGSVECLIPYWDQDQTNEIHIIAENTGQTNSKVFVNIIFSDAD